METPPWLVLLTDCEDDPCLVNLAHVTSVVAHMSGGACLTFTSRDVLVVQQTPQEIVTLAQAAGLDAWREHGRAHH